MLDVAVVNTWRAYQTANKEDEVSLFDVRRTTALAFLNRKRQLTSKCLGGMYSYHSSLEGLKEPELVVVAVSSLVLPLERAIRTKAKRNSLSFTAHLSVSVYHLRRT
jgi:hypothetical protein